MLENWKPRSVVAAMLITTTLSWTQTQTLSQSGGQLPEGPATQNAPISAPLKPFTFPDYTQGKRQFPDPTSVYQPTEIPQPSFTNAPRLESLIKNGTLYLSLSDAIALALENNLDLAIARYNLPIADLDILRAKAGQGLLGVPTGLVQGTQGGGGVGLGGSGAGAGGTSAGAGGAGAGTAGLVESTLGIGPAIPQLDPTLTGNFQLENSAAPQTNSILSGGVNTLQQHSTVGNFTYNQGFVTGTTLQVGYNNNRTSTNSAFNTFNPLLNSSFRATVTQHLLNGFGISNNNRFIRIAKNNKRIGDLAFQAQIITTVSQIEDIYWDLVNAYENVRVQEDSVAVAKRLLSDNQRQVQIGTLAPISVVQAQSQLATSNQNLIVAQTNLQLEQYLMLNAVARNVSSPALANAPVVPTDTMDFAAYQDQNLDATQLIDLALKQSPTLLESVIDLQNRNISRRAGRNALLPTVDVYAFYGASAIAGPQNPLNTCPNSNGFSPCTPPGTFAGSGFSDAFGNLFNSSAPDKGVGFNVLIPIRNRAAQSDQIRSEIELQQAQLRLQQLKNQVIVDVKNAVYAVQQDRAQVDAAREAQTYAQQNLEAEQKKYGLGASTSYNVMTLANTLAISQSSLLTAVTAYQKARVQLDLITNETLHRYGIEIGEGIHGEVTTQPTVPGVAPRQSVAPTQTQQQQQQQQQQQNPNQQQAPPPAANPK